MIPAVGPTAETQSEPQHQQGVILIIDESLPVRRKLAEILHKLAGATHVLEAATPEEALAAFRGHQPHVVFAELIGVHPEDGLEIVHEMLEADPAARIVLVTAEARDSAEVRAAIRAGVFAFVEKPLRYEKIRQVLADLEAEEGGIERLR